MDYRDKFFAYLNKHGREAVLDYLFLAIDIELNLDIYSVSKWSLPGSK